MRGLFAKGLGKPIGHLSTFKQLQACQGRVKGENLVKGPNNFIIQCKGVRGHDHVNQLKTPSLSFLAYYGHTTLESSFEDRVETVNLPLSGTSPLAGVTHRTPFIHQGVDQVLKEAKIKWNLPNGRQASTCIFTVKTVKKSRIETAYYRSTESFRF